MDLRFEVLIRIQKPVDEVFDAVQNPAKLSAYFTNGGASAPLVEGSTVEWAFADTPGKTPFKFPVAVKKVVAGRQIIIEWEGSANGNTTVEMNFEPSGGDSTLVRISESGWGDSQDELQRSYGNCMGWSQMLSALKAYTEYGINLRKGAYEGLFSADDASGNSD